MAAFSMACNWRLSPEKERPTNVAPREIANSQVSIGGSSFPATATSSRELLLQADTLAEEVRQEQGHDSTYRLRERPDTS